MSILFQQNLLFYHSAFQAIRYGISKPFFGAIFKSGQIRQADGGLFHHPAGSLFHSFRRASVTNHKFICVLADIFHSLSIHAIAVKKVFFFGDNANQTQLRYLFFYMQYRQAANCIKSCQSGAHKIADTFFRQFANFPSCLFEDFRKLVSSKYFWSNETTCIKFQFLSLSVIFYYQ